MKTSATIEITCKEFKFKPNGKRDFLKIVDSVEWSLFSPTSPVISNDLKPLRKLGYLRDTTILFHHIGMLGKVKKNIRRKIARIRNDA